MLFCPSFRGHDVILRARTRYSAAQRGTAERRAREEVSDATECCLLGQSAHQSVSVAASAFRANPAADRRLLDRHEIGA